MAEATQHSLCQCNNFSEWGDGIQSGDLSVIVDSGEKCAVAVEGVVDPGNVLNDTVSVSTSTLTNEHSKNIAKSSDEHNEHSRNTSNVTDAHTSAAEHSDLLGFSHCPPLIYIVLK